VFSQPAVEGDSDVIMNTPDIPKTPSKRPHEEVETEEDLPHGTKRLRSRKNGQKGKGKAVTK